MRKFYSAEERREYFRLRPGSLWRFRASHARAKAAYRARNPGYDKTPHQRMCRVAGKRIRQSGFKVMASVSELLGMSTAKFVKYIESRFRDGMTWDNWGTVWQLDHIKPVRLFDQSTLKGQKAAHDFSNWQPLLIAEHRAKTARERSAKRG